MIPPMSTVSEKSEFLEASVMGSALSRSMRSKAVSVGDVSYNANQMSMGASNFRMNSRQSERQGVIYDQMNSIDQTADARATSNIVEFDGNE